MTHFSEPSPLCTSPYPSTLTFARQVNRTNWTTFVTTGEGALVWMNLQRCTPPPRRPPSPPCRLDLSAELFGGVAAACEAGSGPGSLDRGRCCPVLAASLFAAHACTTLSVPAPAPVPAGK
ncbi:hypothetical protein ZWY2020_001543 [Hordeum vulgare]|nr:hypothetical protein ZWY2020_001543 [Hordeum vulgare]